MGRLAAYRQSLMLSTQQLGTIYDHFRSETAAPAVYAAVTALAGYEVIEVNGVISSIQTESNAIHPTGWYYS